MKIVNLKCPNCGGKVKFKENDKHYKCDFCKYDFLIDDEVVNVNIRVDDSEKIEKYLFLADRYFNNCEYNSALDYYMKVLEIDPENHKVVMREALIKTILNGDCNYIINVIVKYLKSNGSEKIEGKYIKETLDYFPTLLNNKTFSNINIALNQIITYYDLCIVGINKVDDNDDSKKFVDNLLLEGLKYIKIILRNSIPLSSRLYFFRKKIIYIKIIKGKYSCDNLENFLTTNL